MVANPLLLAVLLLFRYTEANISSGEDDGESSSDYELHPIFENFNTTLDLIKHLQETGDIKTQKVADVLLKINRENYLSNLIITQAGQIDKNLVISLGIRWHAYILETLKDHLKEGIKVLDVGSGSGYSTVCFALMVGNTGRVIGIEVEPEYGNRSIANVKKDNPELLNSGRITFLNRNGSLGLPEEAPFDVIFVSPYVNKRPEVLVNQLKNGGRMVISIKHLGVGLDLVILDKHKNGTIHETVRIGEGLPEGRQVEPLDY